MTATAKTQCLCQTFEFGTFEPELDNDYGTGCAQTTTKVFAQGHDAKLVGYLVRAELGGEEIRRNTHGVIHSFHGAVHAASSVSEALAAKAQAQLDAARARLAKKAAAEAKKAARKSNKVAATFGISRTPVEAPAPVKLLPLEARIKVGRWEYNAQVDRDTREATYKSKLGAVKTAAEGTYTLL